MAGDRAGDRVARPRAVARRTLLTGSVAAAGGIVSACAVRTTASRFDRGAAPAGRLVTLDGATAGLAVLVGRPQVGTVSFLAKDPIVRAITALQPSPAADLSAMSGQVDLERLVAVRPELVAGLRDPVAGHAVERLGSLFSVRSVSRTGELTVDTRALGVAIGRPKATESALSQWHTAARTMAARLPGLTVSLLTPGLRPSSLYTLGAATPAGSVAVALGLRRPAAQRDLDDPAIAFRRVPIERVTEHDADVLFLLTGPTADPAPLREQPLWARLDAVRDERVVEVDVMQWATLSSLLGHWWVLDDLVRTMLDRASPVLGAASPDGIQRLHRYRQRFATP